MQIEIRLFKQFYLLLMIAEHNSDVTFSYVKRQTHNYCDEDSNNYSYNFIQRRLSHENVTALWHPPQNLKCNI